MQRNYYKAHIEKLKEENNKLKLENEYLKRQNNRLLAANELYAKSKEISQWETR